MPQEIGGVRTFRALIHWLAERYHGGHFFPMAERIGVSSALVDQWQRGVVKRPTIVSVEKLCAAYDLELVVVLRLVTSPPPRPTRKPLPIAGGSDAFPIQQGPGTPGTPPLESHPNPLPLIGPRWLAWLWPMRPCPQLA